jgi:hypothetical protein
MNSAMSKQTRRLVPAIAHLKAREERAAVKAAHAHLLEELSDRFRIFGAELRIDKPEKSGAVPQRMIAVLVVDYGKRRNLVALVDAKGKVVKVEDLRGAQPAYISEEIAEAREIAEQDARVARVAKRKTSFVSEFGPERASDNARLIGLRYFVAAGKGRARPGLARAVVDLSARRLVEFQEMPAAPAPAR